MQPSTIPNHGGVHMQPSTIPPILFFWLKLSGKCLHCLHYICKVPPFCLH